MLERVGILQAKGVELHVVAEEFDDDFMQAIEAGGEKPAASEMLIDVVRNVFAGAAGFVDCLLVMHEHGHLIVGSVGQ